MTRVLAGLCLAVALFAVAFGQSTAPRPTFEIADVHTSPRSTVAVMRVSARAGRYEVHNATTVDLIRTAYSVDADNVLGGPGWLEFDRFDVIALVPPNTTPDTQKLMLQSLLADRFNLVVRNDTKPLAGMVLSMGKANQS